MAQPLKAWRGYSEAAAQRNMKDFKSQNLANTAWAYATVEHKDEQLFRALAAAAQRRMKDFNSQNLVNTL